MDAVDELIRRIAAELLDAASDLSAQVSSAIADRVPGLANDAAVAHELDVSTRANILRFLRVAASTDPEVAAEHLARDAPPEALDVARMFVRRGIDLETLAHTYRWGQNAAWQVWMRRAVEVSPPELLPAVLERSSARMFAYVDGVLAVMRERVEVERGHLQRGTAARREQTVRLLLDGAPVDPAAAGRLLGHDLDGHHTAFVLWVDPGVEIGHGDLERAAAAVASAAGAGRLLTIAPGRTSVWGWIAGEGVAPAAALAEAAGAVSAAPRIAIGGTHHGIEGFRRSHEEAVTAQGMLLAGGSDRRSIAYRDVEVVALLTPDRQRLRAFVLEVLGPLATDPRGTADLARTLRTYLAEGESAARTASRLGTHRNTVLGRLGRAEALLGHPIAERRLALAVALEAEATLRVARPG